MAKIETIYNNADEKYIRGVRIEPSSKNKITADDLRKYIGMPVYFHKGSREYVGQVLVDVAGIPFGVGAFTFTVSSAVEGAPSMHGWTIEELNQDQD